mgnify:CR=1 FL=1
MGIEYYPKERVFKLDSRNSTYMIGVLDKEGFLGHIYYGKRIDDYELSYLLRTEDYPYLPSINQRERVSILDRLPIEYSTQGIGDYRESCLNIQSEDGTSACELFYLEHNIYPGKKPISGLPSSFGSEEDCMSLELICMDPVLSIEVILHYTVYEDTDVITRSVVIRNVGKGTKYLDKVLSICCDFEGMDYDVITLHGSWGRERHIQRRKIGYGKYSSSSIRGESSHQDHPFMAVLSHEANEDYGEVFGFNLIYSGNFIAEVEGTQFGNVRFTMGINPENFRWKLAEGECFTAPEVVMVYSDKGVSKMTHNFHDFYRKHLIRSKYLNRKRPILINNWEATYFDFNTDKLLAIAREASKLGIEMLVMDDGWFGNRNDDNCSLGDWFVNEDKIQGGLGKLVEKINELGMEFGIWFEPEMISPDSELYREHPDWAIQIQGRTPVLSRNQLVLDMSRKEVRDEIFNRMKAILDSANIKYVKWDMNRSLSNLGSIKLSPEQQGELSHRYMLGVYELLERFTCEYPDILLEGCSGGGARYDPGMLYYCPQIWCSDDTDAIERLRIQEGTAMIYPLSTMGAHVSDCPNHTVSRVTPFETRGYVALAGTFGYELDVTKISEEERNQIPKQVKEYHKYNDLIRNGDYYRISSYGEDCHYDCWEVVSKDKSEALVFYIQVLGRPNQLSTRIRLKGLEENSLYQNEESGLTLTGGAYMSAGIIIREVIGDFQGKLIHIVKKTD